MIATFKETVQSAKDTKFGTVIVKKTVGQAIWYWAKYLITFAVMGICLGIAALTYYVPQLPKFALENLPDMQIAVKDGQFSTTAVEPFVRGDEDFTFIIDTKGDISGLDNFKNGILILKDRVVAKSENETRIIDLKEVEDFSANRTDVVNWLKTHQSNLLGIGMVATLITVAFLAGFFFVWQMMWFAIWALIMILVGKLMKKPIDFTNALKIVVYASVISLILRVLISLIGIDGLSILAFVAFLFYALSWIRNLNTK